MKKKTTLGCTFLVLFIIAVNFVNAQGLGDLAERAANSVLDYFKDKHNIKTSVITFENMAGISDLTAQKFYQLLVSKLEAANNPQFGFIDLMINFHKNKGEFNLNRTYLLNHLIYIKLTRNKNKIGAGVSIFSKIGDKIVYIKYVEVLFTAWEKDIYNTTNYGFTAAGFSKIIEIEANPGLLDFKTVRDQNGLLDFLFYYPEKIEFHRLNENRLDKFLSYNLNWAPPYYPVMEYEGKLSCFIEDGIFYVTAGANFSKTAKLLVFKEEPWNKDNIRESTVDFVPFKRIELNNTYYLAGARYAVGKNFFENTLILIPFQSGQFVIESGTYLEKEVPPFYSLDFSTDKDTNALQAVHIIDRDYRYRFLTDNFEQMTVEEEEERGGSLCSLDGQWLAVSDFSRGNDRLYFYKIEGGSRQLVFQNHISGEIVFISNGQWKAARGFWVYVKKQKTIPDTNTTATEYNLQFWSKKSEQ